MAIGTGTQERFEIGRVITRLFHVIGENAITFFGLAVLASIPSLLVTYFSAAYLKNPVHVAGGHPGQLPFSSATLPAVIGGAIAGFLVYLVFAYVLQAAFVYGTISTLNGRKASFAECLATGVRNALPLTAIAVLALFGVMIGFVLLIVPGVILGLMWCVVTPVRVAERTSIMETFGRSAELTRGHRGSIFGLLVIYLALATVLDFGLRLLTGLSLITTAGMHYTAGYIVGIGLIRVVTSMVAATGIASVYYELRMVKEGIGPEQLAAVFA